MDLDKAKSKMLRSMPHPDLREAIERAWAAGDLRSKAHMSAKPGNAPKLDIRGEHQSLEVDIQKGGKTYTAKMTAGWSGRPGLVQSIRNPGAQSKMSGGTGMHASHMFGADRGGAGGAPNMVLNRPWLNKSTFVKHFENMERQVHSTGGRVFSAVVAVFEKGGKHGGSAVPFKVRSSSIVESKSGAVSMHQRNFGHFPLGDKMKDKGSQQLKANNALGGKVKGLFPKGKALIRALTGAPDTPKVVGPNIVRLGGKTK